MPGPYRKCERHGWLHIEEYTVAPDGGAICPQCEKDTHGYYAGGDTPPGPTHDPRPEYVKAAYDYNRRVDHITGEWDFSKWRGGRA